MVVGRLLVPVDTETPVDPGGGEVARVADEPEVLVLVRCANDKDEKEKKKKAATSMRKERSDGMIATNVLAAAMRTRARRRWQRGR